MKTAVPSWLGSEKSASTKPGRPGAARRIRALPVSAICTDWSGATVTSSGKVSCACCGASPSPSSPLRPVPA